MWHIDRIINFGKSGKFQDGFAHFGFHDTHGTQYVMAHDLNWIGALSGQDHFLWTAGEQPPYKSEHHFDIDILKPSFISECQDGSLVVTGKNAVYKLNIASRRIEMLLRTSEEGFDFISNAVVDTDDCIWINDVFGCRIFKYSPSGKLLEILGSGEPGFTAETVPFEKASFNWMYDLRKGHDGNLYVLDSKNYAVRMLDIRNRVVTLVAGTGEPGYSGDGGDPLKATFGGNDTEQFDGPWSLSLDRENNIYIGDTQNHVVRMIERKKKIITTIAGNPDAIPGRLNNPQEKNPFKINLPRICSLDYSLGRLFIPDWDGDLIVLHKTG